MPERENKAFDYQPRVIEFPKSMSLQLMEQWAEIPVFSHNDPEHPEWTPTPVVLLDLTSIGLGKVYVKNEAVETNPTRTIKDRPAWEWATLYRDLARRLYTDFKANALTERELNQMSIPHLTVITHGNEGRALAWRFAQHNLPPPKLIIDSRLDFGIGQALYKERADIYPVDLSKELSEKEILKLSDNAQGVSISSDTTFEPHAIFYDWHVHESFNEQPDNIIVPFGSGRLRDNYLYWQGRTLDNHNAHTPDPRLRADYKKVLETNIIAIEQTSGAADKLLAKFKPFLFFNDAKAGNWARFGRTGKGTRKFQYGKELDEYIWQAKQVYTEHGIETEPSGATALAGFIALAKKDQVDLNRKNLVINSGAGLVPQEAGIS